jgi:hypothetical protein
VAQDFIQRLPHTMRMVCQALSQQLERTGHHNPGPIPCGARTTQPSGRSCPVPPLSREPEEEEARAHWKAQYELYAHNAVERSVGASEDDQRPPRRTVARWCTSRGGDGLAIHRRTDYSARRNRHPSPPQ